MYKKFLPVDRALGIARLPSTYLSTYHTIVAMEIYLHKTQPYESETTEILARRR